MFLKEGADIPHLFSCCCNSFFYLKSILILMLIMRLKKQALWNISLNFQKHNTVSWKYRDYVYVFTFFLIAFLSVYMSCFFVYCYISIHLAFEYLAKSVWNVQVKQTAWQLVNKIILKISIKKYLSLSCKFIYFSSF